MIRPVSLAGTRLGSYEIRALIGSGGMGEVYRAHDTRLRRDVAVKSLPPSFIAGAEDVRRFEREARTLAGLNHPGIATIYGLEHAGDARFIVMELVEGGTLAERLSRGPLPVTDALRLARDVADALHAAHEKGIVHRDLKPANIALTGDGRPKVLDFGLAKSLAPPSADTTLDHATLAGTVMGTAPYMSPEQARGAPVDKRSDIWAFGCVLYEMLTGRQPFAGTTTSDVLAAILEREPDYRGLPDATPVAIRHLLRRCLTKDASRRLHDIADARIELDDALANPRPDVVEAHAPSRPANREMVAWLLAAAGVAAALLLVAFGGPKPSTTPPGPVLRVPLSLPADLRFASVDPATRFAISPDGTRLVLVAADASGVPMLWIRPLDGTGGAQPIAGTEGASFPFWSPDSKAIAFISRPAKGGVIGGDGRLLRVDVSGGQPVTVADQTSNATGAWGPDDTILFTPRGNAPLHRVSAVSPADPLPVGALDVEAGDVQHSYPSVLPDGRHFVYTVIGSPKGANEARGVYLGTVDGSASPKLLLPASSQARYASGHLIFLRDATLFAQRFDPDTLTLQGDPRVVAEHLQITPRLSGGTGAFSVADTGVLAYQTGVGVRSQLAWVERRTARQTPVGDQADYGDVKLSPDATRAVVSMLDPQVGTRDLWTYDLARGLPERFTSDPGDEYAPVWGPRGDRIAYTSTRDGSIQIFEESLSRRGQPRQVDSGGSPLGKFAATWSPDGEWLLFIAGGRALARSDLHKVPMHAGGKASALLESGFVESQVRFSPDGRWIAYASNETSRMEVYIRPFPDGPSTRVSVQGGGWPTWRADTTEIFFLAPDGTLMATPVSLKDGVRIGTPQPLFKVRLRPIGRLDAYMYDVTPDGQRFLMNTFVEEAASTGLTLLVNWPAAVR